MGDILCLTESVDQVHEIMVLVFSASSKGLDLPSQVHCLTRAFPAHTRDIQCRIIYLGKF